jgi:hypothetical protein
LQASANTVYRHWRGEQMDVIGHQHISMNAQAILVGGLLQPIEIGRVIVISGKDGLPIIAALDDVLWHPG